MSIQSHSAPFVDTLQFLKQILQSLAQKSNTPEVIYPLLEFNLDKLTSFKDTLYVWSTKILPQMPNDYAAEMARVTVNFCNVLQGFLQGDRSNNLEIAIVNYEAIGKSIFTKTALPIEWAATMMNLGNAYKDRIIGTRNKNIEQAIVHYQEALTVFTKSTTPSEWAATMINLGNAYVVRIDGKLTENLCQAWSCYEQAKTIPAFQNAASMRQCVFIDLPYLHNNTADLIDSIDDTDIPQEDAIFFSSPTSHVNDSEFGMDIFGNHSDFPKHTVIIEAETIKDGIDSLNQQEDTFPVPLPSLPLPIDEENDRQTPSSLEKPIPPKPSVQPTFATKTNYILIDFENVQPDTIEQLNKENFKVLVFVGPNQSKIPFDTVQVLQQMGERAQYIKVVTNGSNALDFHIAFYLGQLSQQDPTGYFHVISKDTGFDPLMQYLKSLKIRANRWDDVMFIPVIQAESAKTLPEKVDLIVKNLEQRKVGKPKTVQALSNTIKAILQNTLSENEIASLIKALKKQGFVTIEGDTVSYPTLNTISIPNPTIQHSSEEKTPAEKIALIVGNLQRSGKAKPATVQTLFNHINSLFKKTLSEQEIVWLIQVLQNQHIITIEGSKISYTLPQV
jgi:hypothetical protein